MHTSDAGGELRRCSESDLIVLPGKVRSLKDCVHVIPVNETLSRNVAN